MPGGLPPVIPGFPPSNRVPGAYGQVVPGTGGQSAASLPKKLLVVALKGSAGSITPDTQIVPILTPTDADTFAGVGTEGACCLYDAILIAASLGIPLFYASPTPAGGGTNAKTSVKIVGTATGIGSVTVRVNGKNITQGIAVGDTGATVCTNLATAINGFASQRSPCSASASTNYCSIQNRTPGQRGMQTVVFLDVSQIAPGLTATLYVTWTASQTWALGDQVIPATPNGFYFQCTTAGTGTGTTPTWTTTPGTTVSDGTATFTCMQATATGSVPTTAVFLGNATGLETYTALLQTLTSQSFDRWGLAANDAVSLAAIKSQIDQYAGAPYNFLQHVCVGSNGTLAAAQSIAQTTLNDTRFQLLWQLNGETHPSRVATAMAAYRTGAEQSNPNAGYDDLILATVAPQTQALDIPSLPTLITATNNSLTSVYTKGDGYARVVRSITTKSLTNGFADYSTIDTGMQVVPDFILQDGKLYWTTVIAPQNPVVRDDPTNPSEKVPSGVMTPSRATAAFMGKLGQYAKGILSSTPGLGGSATIPPIILTPQAGDVTSVFDPVAQRIMTAETVHVMPLNHQIGISVLQAS